MTRLIIVAAVDITEALLMINSVSAVVTMACIWQRRVLSCSCNVGIQNKLRLFIAAIYFITNFPHTSSDDELPIQKPFALLFFC